MFNNLLLLPGREFNLKGGSEMDTARCRGKVAAISGEDKINLRKIIYPELLITVVDVSSHLHCLKKDN